MSHHDESLATADQIIEQIAGTDVQGIEAIITKAYAKLIMNIAHSDKPEEIKEAQLDAITQFQVVLKHLLEPNLRQLKADKDLLFEIANRLTKLC